MNKKILSIAFAMGIAASAFGTTVTIDWSVDQIIKPTEVNSNTSTGSSVTYEIVLKNNGTDSAKAGDTVLYQVGLTYTSGTPIVIAPSTSSFYFKLLTRSVKNGDTIHIKGSFNFASYPYPSVTVNFIALSHVVNRARGLDFEPTGTRTNNLKTASITWFNPQGWPVSVKDADAGTTKVFPTVAKDEINISLPAVAIGKPVSVKIFTVLGNLVSEKTFTESGNSYKVSTSGLANGTYLVSVEVDGKISTSKVIVQK